MHYFISTREDYSTSAIELAQVKRMKIFDALGVSNFIVEIQKNDFIEETRRKLQVHGHVINIFQYFQKLPDKRVISTENKLAQILEQKGLVRKGNTAYLQDKAVIQAHLYGDRLYYVDHLDQYGFTVKRDFYSYNHLNYTEYFDDQAHMKMREFMDQNNNPVIREYFCQSNRNQPMLTLIELKSGLLTLRFEKEADFQAYFLDQLAQKDQQAVFYCDRCTQVLPAIKKMEYDVSTYVVFHSALTPSGYLNEPIYSVYQPIIELAEKGRIKGVISSTKREAEDAVKALGLNNSFAIPVTYIDSEAELPFSNRQEGKIIAVARVDAIKQLDHLIKAVVQLHHQDSKLDLSIYGNNTDKAEGEKLQKLVADNNAESYVHFCGFAQNLDDVYNSAQLEVLTSKNEGFAMALLEAQAHGCPAISYDINYGPEDIIADGVSGELVPANNEVELVRTISKLIFNPELLAKYSTGAYQHAQKFDFAHLKQIWHNFLKHENLT